MQTHHTHTHTRHMHTALQHQDQRHNPAQPWYTSQSRVMSLNESCHIWINFTHIDTNSRRPSNVTNPAKPWSISQSRVMSHMNEPCHILTPMPPRPAQHHEPRHVTYEVTRHILIPMRPPNITSLVMSHINKLCHTWLPMPGAQATSRT